MLIEQYEEEPSIERPRTAPCEPIVQSTTGPRVVADSLLAPSLSGALRASSCATVRERLEREEKSKAEADEVALLPGASNEPPAAPPTKIKRDTPAQLPSLPTKSSSGAAMKRLSSVPMGEDEGEWEDEEAEEAAKDKLVPGPARKVKRDTPAQLPSMAINISSGAATKRLSSIPMEEDEGEWEDGEAEEAAKDELAPGPAASFETWFAAVEAKSSLVDGAHDVDVMAAEASRPGEQLPPGSATLASIPSTTSMVARQESPSALAARAAAEERATAHFRAALEAAEAVRAAVEGAGEDSGGGVPFLRPEGNTMHASPVHRSRLWSAQLQARRHTKMHKIESALAHQARA